MKDKEKKFTKVESFIFTCLFISFVGILISIMSDSISGSIGCGLFFVGICILGSFDDSKDKP